MIFVLLGLRCCGPLPPHRSQSRECRETLEPLKHENHLLYSAGTAVREVYNLTPSESHTRLVVVGTMSMNFSWERLRYSDTRRLSSREFVKGDNAHRLSLDRPDISIGLLTAWEEQRGVTSVPRKPEFQ